jgi:hypothetical protein
MIMNHDMISALFLFLLFNLLIIPRLNPPPLVESIQLYHNVYHSFVKFLSSTSSLNIHSPTMSITMAAESWLLSQPSSLLYTKTKFPIISNYVKPFKLQNPSLSSSCNNNTSTLPLTTRRRITRHSSVLTFAIGAVGNSSQDLKIFVGNLTSDINVDKLTALFGQAGTVVHAEVSSP